VSDWALIISGGVLFVAVVVMILNNYATKDAAKERLLSQYLSIREHTEYKLSVQREMDKLHERINLLEQTRPTTETLQAKIEATKVPNKRAT
jgi:hypothetical protein